MIGGASPGILAVLVNPFNENNFVFKFAETKYSTVIVGHSN